MTDTDDVFPIVVPETDIDSVQYRKGTKIITFSNPVDVKEATVASPAVVYFSEKTVKEAMA